MSEITIIDSTLRDGSHALKHQLTSETIREYAKGAEEAGIKLLMVGHGNGLGASSLQLGRSLLSDQKMLSVAKKELINTKLGAFLIPGFGTIKDNLKPAIEIGVDEMMVASHCTEANITKQHIEFLTKENVPVYGVLMMTHMISPKELLEQAKLMQEFGAKGVLIMDSAGAFLPEDVERRIYLLTTNLKIDIGFHAHNNLGLAIYNSITAVNHGAKIIDATSRGLGAGAGNCQLEVLAAVLEKYSYKTNLNLYKLMNNSEKVIKKIMPKPQEITAISLVSGLAGVFSGFAPHAEKAAKKFNVDARDILIELGKRRIIAGQEDIIIEVAYQLAKNKKYKNETSSIEALI